MSEEQDGYMLNAFGVDLGQVAQVVDDAASTVSSGASTALDLANTAGKAVMSGESAALDEAKGAYQTVAGAYDSVAPNFTKDNQTLGSLVDNAEAAAKGANDKAAAEYADVPVVGTLAQASAAISNTMIDATGGVVKGVGDLTTMAGNAVFHPIDAAASMAEGAIGIAEHVPLLPGLNTTAKGIHGLVDLARGKTDGEYGSSLSDLGENLLLGTHQDPNKPNDRGARTNSDVDFVAGIGGGTKAWSEKPAEAATRTITNVLPMLLGDEGAIKGEPVPEGGAPHPEGGPPPTLADPPTLPGLGEPPPTLPDPKTLRGLGSSPVPEPFGEAPSVADPIPSTEVGEPPTLRTPPPAFGEPIPEAPVEGPPTGVDPATLPGLGEPVPPTEPGIPPTERGIPPTRRTPTSPLGEPISPLADSVPGSQVGKPAPFEIPPTERPPAESPIPPTLRSTEPVSPLAESVRPPSTAEPIPQGPPTEVDPPKPQPEPESPKANVAETPAQAQQNLSDAIADQKAAEQASREASQEVVRFRANKPFDPDVAAALEDEARRASAANVEAIRNVEAAERAVRDAAGRAKGGRGFPPPRR